jgi:hypothetical protein
MFYNLSAYKAQQNKAASNLSIEKQHSNKNFLTNPIFFVAE